MADRVHQRTPRAPACAHATHPREEKTHTEGVTNTGHATARRTYMRRNASMRTGREEWQVGCALARALCEPPHP